jgi:hypothetical protein
VTATSELSSLLSLFSSFPLFAYLLFSPSDPIVTVSATAQMAVQTEIITTTVDGEVYVVQETTQVTEYPVTTRVETVTNADGEVETVLVTEYDATTIVGCVSISLSSS